MSCHVPAKLRTPAWNHIASGHPTPARGRSALILKWLLNDLYLLHTLRSESHRLRVTRSSVTAVASTRLARHAPAVFQPPLDGTCPAAAAACRRSTTARTCRSFRRRRADRSNSASDGL